MHAAALEMPTDRQQEGSCGARPEGQGAPLSCARRSRRTPPGGRWQRGPGREPPSTGRHPELYQTDAAAPRAAGTRKRAPAGRAAQARAPPWPRRPTRRRSTRGAGQQEAGGAVGALPRPRLPVGALCCGRVVGLGLSGSSSAGQAAGDPAEVRVPLCHARCRGLSPSIPASMKDSGDSKDQQLMVRPHQPPPQPRQWPRLQVGLWQSSRVPSPPS